MLGSEHVRLGHLRHHVCRPLPDRRWTRLGHQRWRASSYSLTVSGNHPFTAQALRRTTWRLSGRHSVRSHHLHNHSGWNCAIGVSCQDVWDFQTLAPGTVTVTVSAVTGNSVLRLAAFDGAALNTVNRLNGNLTDRKCTGQNANDTAVTPVLPPGLHRFAIGRDWDTSAGAAGTYTVTFTSTVPVVWQRSNGERHSRRHSRRRLARRNARRGRRLRPPLSHAVRTETSRRR